MRGFRIGICCALWLVAPLLVQAQEDAKPEKTPLKKELFSGKMVFAGEALKRKGIRAADEIAKQVVLETTDGEVIPLLPDWRGRAFFQDERLRDRRVEVIGTRKHGLPYLQVLVVYTFDDEGNRQYTDYWCDICAIPMYEIKPCDCCQGDIRLRFQEAELPDYITGKTAKSDAAAESGAPQNADE